MSKHTPGPWNWVLNPKFKTLTLASREWVVMSFERWGMGGATPLFKHPQKDLRRAIEFVQVIPCCEHHKEWALDLDHPDARLIAAAPELLEVLENGVGFIEDYAGDCVQQNRPEQAHVAYVLAEAARAVIAKIKGGVE